MKIIKGILMLLLFNIVANYSHTLTLTHRYKDWSNKIGKFVVMLNTWCKNHSVRCENSVASDSMKHKISVKFFRKSTHTHIHMSFAFKSRFIWLNVNCSGNHSIEHHRTANNIQQLLFDHEKFFSFFLHSLFINVFHAVASLNVTLVSMWIDWEIYRYKIGIFHRKKTRFT